MYFTSVYWSFLRKCSSIQCIESSWVHVPHLTLWTRGRWTWSTCDTRLLLSRGHPFFGVSGNEEEKNFPGSPCISWCFSMVGNTIEQFLQCLFLSMWSFVDRCCISLPEDSIVEQFLFRCEHRWTIKYAR